MKTNLLLLGVGAYACLAQEVTDCEAIVGLTADNTMFETNLKCLVLLNSTPYLGSKCPFTAVAPPVATSNGIFVEQDFNRAFIEHTTDCGCVTYTKDNIYTKECPLSTTLGDSEDRQPLAMVFLNWRLDFTVNGGATAIESKWERIQTGPARLPVTAFFATDLTYDTELDQMKPLRSGAAVPVKLEAKIPSGIDQAEIFVGDVKMCNLGDTGSASAICAKLSVPSQFTEVVSNTGNLETRIVFILNLPFEVQGTWTIEINGGLRTLDDVGGGRRILDTSTSPTFTIFRSVEMEKTNQTTVPSSAPSTVQGFYTVALTLLSMSVLS